MENKKIYSITPDYYHRYLDMVQSDNLIVELENSKLFTLSIIDLIDSENENFAYQPNKWTIKEVLQHIIDCERVFAYRAFRFSRFDNTTLRSFDENQYTEHIKPAIQTLSDIRDEYIAVRHSTISLYKNMSDEMLDFEGVVEQNTFSARALGYMIIGHNIHHCNIIKSKYLGVE